MKTKSGRVQIGALIDKGLWLDLKAQAIQNERGAGYLLDDAITMYLQAPEQNKK